ncbi:MAG: MFS transporter [Chloroflexota bacterium]
MTDPASSRAWWHSRGITAVLAANVVSGAGNVLTSMALPWLVIESGGGGAEIGVIGFAQLVPLIGGALLGGIIVDRAGGRAASIAADLASAATVVAIAAFALSGWLPLWLLAVLVFLTTLLDMPGSTGRSVLLPGLAERDGVELASVNAASETVRRLTILLGPIGGGILVATAGPALALIVDAVTFGVSVLLVVLLVPRVAVTGAEAAAPAWRLRDGIRLLWRDRLIRSLMAVSGTINVLLNPVFFVLLPLYVVALGGVASDQGFLVAAFGLGALAGALGSARLARRFGSRRVLTVGALLAGGAPLLLAVAPGMPFAAAAQLVSGLGIGPVGPIVLTVLGTRVAPEVRGRVFGAHATITNAAIPIGVIVTGLVVELLDVRTVLVAITVLFTVSVGPLLFQRALAQLDPAPV